MHSGRWVCTRFRRRAPDARIAPAQVKDAKISVCHGVGGMFAASGTIILRTSRGAANHGDNFGKIAQDMVIIVTGAGCVPDAIALLCAAEGAKVVVNDPGGSADGGGLGRTG